MDKRLPTFCYTGMIVLAMSGLAALSPSAAASPALCVTNFGARGDAFDTLADTVQGSPVIRVSFTNQFSSADVGKLMLVFGAGARTTSTNQQDLVGQIVAVNQGTNITLSAAAGITASQAPVTCGTQNANAFQQCVNACTGTNTVVQVPPGRYLLVPPAMLDANFVMQSPGEAHASVVLRTGGIHFLGADRASSVLLGCGAWMLKGQWVHRGWMFECLGPITNNAPLIFESLTLDGGVQQGRTPFYNSGPARTTDGAGWDITHDAVVDYGGPPLHAVKQFVDCTFTHWRGEMVKSVTSLMDGYIEVTNCAFLDGEASGFNFNFTHRISNCTFSNLDMAMEFYAGYMQRPSVFEGSTVTNVRNAIVLVGALTNHSMPSYTINGNIMASAHAGILLGPGRNVTISSNQFINANIGIGTDDYAYQGSGVNSNIVITANTFQNTGTPFIVAGSGQDAIVNVIISSNQTWNCGRFADGYGWSSNVVFVGNQSLGTKRGVLHSSQLSGQWFPDDPSNDFPWFAVYDSPPVAGIITYGDGMRHALYPAAAASTFTIVQPLPEQIPSGAALMITNAGKYSCVVSTATSAARIAVGGTLTYQFDNGIWKRVGSLPAPQNLRMQNIQ